MSLKLLFEVNCSLPCGIMNICFRSIIASLCISFLFACAGAGLERKAENKEESPVAAKKKKAELSLEEQMAEASSIFNQILELSQEDRMGNLDKMAELYLKIINEYPEVLVAQESFLRLTELYLNVYMPAEEQSAINLYDMYTERYQEPFLKNQIEQIVTSYYYRNGKWKELMTFVSPHIKDFIETEKLDTPSDLFYYSEAKFNLSDYKEAYKGYRIVIKHFPKSSEAKLSKKRIQVIENEIKERAGQE